MSLIGCDRYRSSNHNSHLFNRLLPVAILLGKKTEYTTLKEYTASQILVDHLLMTYYSTIDARMHINPLLPFTYLYTVYGITE